MGYIKKVAISVKIAGVPKRKYKYFSLYNSIDS